MKTFLLAILLCLSCPSMRAVDVLKWDTNTLGSPVVIYKGELLGTAAGDSFTLPTLPSGTTILCYGAQVVIPYTNYITLFLTNFVTKTNVINKTNITTTTVTKTNVVTITNYVHKPPGKK